jgi:predicted ATPase
MQRWGSAVAFRKKSICTLHFRFLCSVPSIFYEQLTKQGDLLHDTEQTRVIEKYLDRLFKQLDGYQLPNLGVVRQESDATNEEPQDQTKEKEILVPRGLYIHGQVGTGKSMLMDLFFQHVRVQHKRRVHFNKFMLEVHERIQIEKKKQLALYGRQRNIVLDPNRDVIATVANQIAEESHLLCFDEFQVTDIADALIMRKLFGIFFSRGLVMVATSNTHPKVCFHFYPACVLLIKTFNRISTKMEQIESIFYLSLINLQDTQELLEFARL